MKKRILLAVCLTALFAINSVIGQTKIFSNYGSSGYIPYFTSGSLIENTNLYFNNSNNRIGMGTTTPGYTFHIYSGSDFFLGTNTSNNFVKFDKNWCGLELKNVASSQYVKPVDFKITAANGCGRFISDYGVAMFLDSRDTTNADDTARFVILADQDNWGSYAKPLFFVEQYKRVAGTPVTVKGGTFSVGRLRVGTVNETDYISLYSDNNESFNFLDSYVKPLNINFKSQQDVNIYGNLSVGNTIKMYGATGNLWVSTEIQINSTDPWSDFVFEPSYKLKSLQEVEAYIKANKHLEGIPSASEIETKGIPLGEIANIHNQKIEELTLYIIDLQKQIDELKKQLDSK